MSGLSRVSFVSVDLNDVCFIEDSISMFLSELLNSVWFVFTDCSVCKEYSVSDLIDELVSSSVSKLHWSCLFSDGSLSLSSLLMEFSCVEELLSSFWASLFDTGLSIRS